MVDWPRDVIPRQVTDFDYPDALKSQSQGGVWNTRDSTRVGRTWDEFYLVKVSDNDAKKFMALIRKYKREGTIFNIDHRDYQTPNGAGGGSPIVQGTAQVGSTLVIDGASNSITGWLLAGDIFTLAGINVAYDVAVTVDTATGGTASIEISPPIYTGASPADNATLTITAVKIRALIVAADFPRSGADDYGLIRVSFAEAP